MIGGVSFESRYAMAENSIGRLSFRLRNSYTARNPKNPKAAGSQPMLNLKVLALALLVPTASNAALLSAQDLVTACSGDGTAKATCDGYLMAVTDAFLQREGRGGGNQKVCVPETITIDQVRAAVLDFAQVRKPERMPSGVLLAVRAIRAKWPCNEAPKDQ
jgi:hypothetical protein